MPTATVEMTRDAAYIVVAFRPLTQTNAVMHKISPFPTAASPTPDLPVGLYDFSPKGECVQRPRLVSLKLPKDERGEVNVLDMMVAADWLQENGWEVVPLGWCAGVFDAVYGLPERGA